MSLHQESFFNAVKFSLLSRSQRTLTNGNLIQTRTRNVTPVGIREMEFLPRRINQSMILKFFLREGGTFRCKTIKQLQNLKYNYKK